MSIPKPIRVRADIRIAYALQANPEELAFQPNILTRRGELRLKLGQGSAKQQVPQ